MLSRILGSRVGASVRANLGKNSVFSNTLTCGLLLTTGDYIQQKLESSLGSKTSYDYKRSGRMFAVGLSQGPPHHYWYVWLDKYLPKRDVRTVVIKILADQVLAAPFFAITFFFGTGILEDRRLSECWLEFRKKFPAVYVVNKEPGFLVLSTYFIQLFFQFDWCIWPPTQYINFLWVPSQFRVLYVNVVTVIWDVFLSFIKHVDNDEEKNPIKTKKV